MNGICTGRLYRLRFKAYQNPEAKIEYIAAYHFLDVVAAFVFLKTFFLLFLSVDPASKSDVFLIPLKKTSSPV